MEQQQAEPPKENRQSTESGSLSILSPFDEKEEWNKISAIIESFGDDIGKDIKDSTTPNNCERDAPNNTIGETPSESRNVSYYPDRNVLRIQPFHSIPAPLPPVEYPTVRRKRKAEAVGEWLRSIKLDKHEASFIDNG